MMVDEQMQNSGIKKGIVLFSGSMKAKRLV